MPEQLQDQSLPVITTLEKHVSIREYLDKDVDNELLRRLLNAARRSPTSSNMQAYSFVVVKNQEIKDKLAVLAGNQEHIRTSGAFVAIIADVSRLEKGAEMHEKMLVKNLENMLVASVDASLVGMSLSIAAESVGLGTCMIGGIRNHPKEVAELLELPYGAYVVFGLTMGWPDHERIKPQKPRMHEDAIIHWESYDSSNHEELINLYDEQLASHYRDQGRNSPDAAYSGIIAKRLSQPRREHLRGELNDLGFSMN